MLRLEDIDLGRGGFRLSADLSLAAGSLCAVLGPSGGGKSTLLGAIAGFEDLRRGRILWGDADLSTAAPDRRPVAMLFQDNNLFPHLSVAGNLALVRPDGHDEVLSAVGLTGLERRKPADLSGGQQSRAALARALLQDKPLLLLDEPFGALGPALKTEMLELVARICRQRSMTLLMVTHDPSDARRIAGQTILVAEGRAHQPQATDMLLDNPPPVLRAYLGD